MAKLEKIIYGLIILMVVIYVGSILFIEMVKSLWNLSPLTSIGFVISVIIAIANGHMNLGKMEGNLRILGFIFGGSILSYAATSMIPDLWGIVRGGDIIGGLIILLVIVLVWFKGQKIKGQE